MFNKNKIIGIILINKTKIINHNIINIDLNDEQIDKILDNKTINIYDKNTIEKINKKIFLLKIIL